MQRGLLLFPASLIVALLASCGESEALDRAKEELRNAARVTEQFVQEQMVVWSDRMDDFAAEFATFREASKAKMAEMSAAAREKFELALNELDEQRAALVVRMDEARAAGGGAWDKASVELQQAWDALQAKYAELQESL